MNSIEQRLAALKSEFGELARALREAADALEQGRWPGAELVNQIGGVELAFGEMLRRVSGTDGASMTMAELEAAVLRKLAESRILPVVRKCRRIVPEVADAQFEALMRPVLECAARVEAGLAERGLAEGAGTGGDEQDVRVLEAVVELVEGRRVALSIERANALQQVVAERFGAMTALALLMRGVLRDVVDEAGGDVSGDAGGDAGVDVARVSEDVEVLVEAVEEVGDAVVEGGEVQVAVEEVEAVEGNNEEVLTRVPAPLFGLARPRRAAAPGKAKPKRKRLKPEEVKRRKEEEKELEAQLKTIEEYLDQRKSSLSEATRNEPTFRQQRDARDLASKLLMCGEGQLDEVEAVKPVVEEGAAQEEKNSQVDSPKVDSPKVDSPKVLRARAEGNAVEAGQRETRVEEISESLEILEAEDASGGAALQVWRLLESGEDALAYHLARGLEEAGERSDAVQVSWRVIRAAILGSQVTRSHGLAIGLIHEDAAHYDSSRYFSKTNQPLNDGLRLLLAAGALIPSVIGGEVSASNVLGDLKFNDSLGCVYDFCQELIALRRKLPMRIGVEHINITRDSALWQAKRVSLEREIREFLKQAPLRTAKMPRATDVWKQWLGPEQPIGGLMQKLLESWDAGRREVEQIERVLSELEDRGALEKMVQAFDRHFHTSKIEGKAIEQLMRFSAEPVSLGRKWIALHQSNPLRDQNDYVQTHIHELRQLLGSRLGEAQQAVVSLGKEQEAGGSVYVRVGVRFLGQALEHLQALFDPESVACEAKDLDPAVLLNTPLLRLEGVALDENYEPLISWREISEPILAGLEPGFPDYEQAFQRQLAREDHLASAQILEVFRSRGLVEDAVWEEMHRLRRKTIRLQRIDLRAMLEKTRQRLDRSVAFGLVIERDRSRYSASLETIEQRLEQGEKSQEETPRFFEDRATLQTIDQELDASLKGQVEAVMQRLDGLVSLDDVVRARLKQILDDGDPVTANDYIDMLEHGEQLPAESKANAFDAFFAEAQFAALERGLQEMGARLPLALRNGEACPGLDLSEVSEAQRKSAEAMLSAWFAVKNQSGKNHRGPIEKILTGLGFRVEKVEEPGFKPNRVSSYKVQVQPLRDRNLCPLASYGSEIKGKYRIVCVRGCPGMDELLSIVGKHDYTYGQIVFYFGRMSREQRRELAALSQREQRSFLVLDDTLLYWLCGERSTRLPAFFQCAAPFTCTAPFDVTASEVAPEMFYGRKWELTELEAPHGTCFIYGGRQLGKTALLRHLVRERHAPQEGRIFVWIDLKASGLGNTKSIDQIGHVIAETLKAENVLPKGMGSNMLEETIYDHIASWLEKDDRQRILVLLDEADRFLELDGNQHFLHCTRLKNLMERTNRRFKVVFAGLHNVQRTTRRENHPLAHFGEPICIGPLYERGEWKEALELIEKPLQTMGFRFASRDLPFRILSQTNFYPSLLQIYGKELLRYLYQHHEQVFDLHQSPPYLIKSQHLQAAYGSQSLRDNIRQKFKFTLQLDQRYEVIVYAIAHEVRHNEPELLIDGLSVNRVRELALGWWEEGFSGIDSGHEIRVLLDEMVGLGVLRQVDAGRYTLRNLNIVLLLGTNQEIDEELLRERTLQAEYEPASFRSSMADGDGGELRRSPLTRAQESQILARRHGVLAVFGTAAAGYEELEPRLKLLCEEKLVSMRGLKDVRAFERALEDACRSRKGDGIWVVHVPTDVAWERAWLGAAARVLQRQQSRRSIVRVVFSGDAARVWELCGQTVDEEEVLRELGVEQIVTLEPWREPAVQMWLRDVEENVMLDNLPAFSTLTGNWPEFLYELHAHARRWKERPDWEGIVAGYRQAMFEPPGIAQQLATFGVPAEVRPLLAAIVEKDGVFVLEDLLRKGWAVEDGQRLVRWGRWLRLIQLSGGAGSQESGFQLDPLFKELLEFSMLQE